MGGAGQDGGSDGGESQYLAILVLLDRHKWPAMYALGKSHVCDFDTVFACFNNTQVLFITCPGPDCDVLHRNYG